MRQKVGSAKLAEVLAIEAGVGDFCLNVEAVPVELMLVFEAHLELSAERDSPFSRAVRNRGRLKTRGVPF